MNAPKQPCSWQFFHVCQLSMLKKLRFLFSSTLIRLSIQEKASVTVENRLKNRCKEKIRSNKATPPHAFSGQRHHKNGFKPFPGNSVFSCVSVYKKPVPESGTFLAFQAGKNRYSREHRQLWRTCSKKQTAAQAATFRDSIGPAWGMTTLSLAFSSKLPLIPFPSCPNNQITGKRKSQSYIVVSV